MESSTVEEYLEALWRLQEEGVKAGTSELARRLSVSPASATEMADRLAGRGLVERRPDGALALTGKGRRAALQVVRRHRISERFLVDVLGMDWKDVHDEACRLEHAISPEVETRMQAMLGEASTCPHGHPIPGPAGRKSAAVPTRKLSTLRKAEKAVIVSIAEEKRDLLEYLAALGMLPESPVAVEQVAPFEGPLLVRVNGALYALGRDVAEKIWVRDEH